MPINNEEDIRLYGHAFQTAWNNKDVKTIISYFTHDCLRVGSFGEVQQGKESIEKAYVQQLKELPNSRFIHDSPLVRFLDEKIATWQAPFELITPESRTIKGYTLAILRKEHGAWLVNELHVRIFPA